MKLSPHIVFIFITVIASFCNAQETLGYSLTKGDVFKIQQEVKKQIVSTVEDTSQEVSNTMGGLMKITVLEAKSDMYTLSLEYLRFKMISESNTTGVLLDVDTQDNPDDDLMNEAFRGLLHIPIIFTMDSQGKVCGVSGSEKLIRNILKGFDAFLPPDSIDQLEQDLTKDFGAKALAASLEQMTFFYPNNKIKVGECWQNNYSGEFSSENTWKLIDTIPSGYLIKGEGPVTVKNDDHDISVSLKGIQKTTIVCDPDSGFINKMIVEQRSEGTSVFKGMDSDITSPTILKSKITYKRI